MPSIRSLLITTALLVFVNWALQVYPSGVLDPEFLVYGQTVIRVERIPAPDPKTAATVRGKTTDARTGSPLKDVHVTMGVSGHGEVAGSAISDATGRYEIRVAPGPYYLSATKDGFVTTQYLDLANVPRLELDTGQVATVDFRMPPGAVIAGTVRDANGAPIADAYLQATMKVPRQGKFEMQLRATARANDRGEYQLPDLPAGRYYVQAGQYGIGAPSIRTFVPIIYPGASRVEDAEAISVAEGEDKSGIDFRLPDSTRHSVSGRVTFLATGQPVANMTIRVDPDGPGFGTNAKTKSRGDGTFRLEGLTAGHYRMEGQLFGDGEGSPQGYFLEFFEVTTADITNLIIHVAHGTTAKEILRAAGGSLPERMGLKSL